MRALQNAIKKGVGNGGIANPGMPMFNRQLTCNNRGPVCRAIVNDLQQIRARRTIDGTHSPIIQNQHVGLGELEQPLSKDAAAVTDAEFFL